MSDTDYSPRGLTRGLVRRWWLMVLLVALGTAGGVAYGMLQKPVYQSQSYVVVVSDAKDTGIAVNFAQAYGRVISQPEVLDRVASEVGIPAEALRTRVQASTSPDAPLIEITASARSAGRSARIANAAVRALVDYGNLHVTETGVRMASFSMAAVPASPSSPRPTLDAAVGAATGVLLGGLAVLAGVGSSRRRTASRRRGRKPAAPDSAAASDSDSDSADPTGPDGGAGTAADVVDGATNGVHSQNGASPKSAAVRQRDTGSEGDTGLEGDTGSKSDTGSEGDTGSKSDVGSEGRTGKKGGDAPKDGDAPLSDAGPLSAVGPPPDDGARKASAEPPGDIPSALAATDLGEVAR